MRTGPVVTLVVVERLGGIVRLTADSELTGPPGQIMRSRSVPQLTLKPILLHPALCVAYAGRAEDALRAIRDLGVNAHTGFRLEDVRRLLLRIHQLAGGEMDFLIASLSPTPSVTKIAGGEVIDCDRAFVGLPRAYDAYRRVYEETAEGEGTVGQRVGNRMEAAMEAVVEDQSVAGVGGFCIRVASDYQNGFTYLASAIIASTQVQVTPETPVGDPIPIPLQGVGGGGYRYAISAPVQPGVGALAIYFQPGDFGLLLYPKVSLHPLKFSRVTHDAFLSQVGEQYALRLHRLAPLRPVEDMTNPFAIQIEQ